MERRLHLFWPMTLIAAGVLWILIQMGRIPAANLWALTYLWPLFLIAAGLGLILRPYWRYAGAVLSALVVVVLFLAIVFAGQLGWNRLPLSFAIGHGSVFAGPTVRGSGNVITENRTVQGFSTIHVEFPASVLIKQGASESLTIQGDDNVVKDIRTRVSGGELQIDSPRDRTVYVDVNQPVKITITVKDLREINFDSAGELTVEGLKADALSTVLNGAGNMSLTDVQLGSLKITLSGAGSLHATGVAKSLDAQLDGFGNFDGTKLQANTATVTLNGLGGADVWVKDSLTAEVNGMGSVGYYGSPQVTRSVNGLGGVHSLGTK
ncbi:MAG: GIN domain-containing protein [Anaerolineae bacterium]